MSTSERREKEEGQETERAHKLLRLRLDGFQMYLPNPSAAGRMLLNVKRRTAGLNSVFLHLD